MSEKEQLSAMLLELHARCPTLCPAVVPAGCDDRESGTAMLALSRDAQERQALVSLLSSARRAATHCALTDRETPEQDLRFVAFWQLDAARATYRLTRCAFVCTEAATLLDVSGFLQRFTKHGSDTQANCPMCGGQHSKTPSDRTDLHLQACKQTHADFAKTSASLRSTATERHCAPNATRRATAPASALC